MAIKLQIRRDTLTNWNANSSVVLLEGEIGYVTDTRNMKIGDGTTVWSSLKYQAPYYTAANTGAANTVLSVDAGNGRVGIGNASPASTLDVTGQVRVRGTGAYSAPADNVAAINYDSTSGVMTVDARSNAGSTVIAVHTSNATAGAERLRISSAGNVGIGATNPSNLVHLKGASPVIRLEDTDGADSNLYCLIDADNVNGTLKLGANNGNVVAQQNNAFVGINVNGTERFRANSTGVQLTGTTISSGALTVSTGGLTVSAGTVTGPAGSIAGAALADNGVTVAKLAQLAAGNFLGNSTGSTANVAAVTQAQARTMLGLGSSAYLSASSTISTSNWVDLAVAGTGTLNQNFSVSSLTIGQPTLVALQFARSANSAVLNANLVLASTDIVTIISASDDGTTNTTWGTTASSNQCAWYRRNSATAGDKDYPGPITLTGAQTFLVFRWQQVSGNSTNGPRAYVYMVRQQ